MDWTTIAQGAMQFGIGLFGASGAVALLFKTMTSGYGGIITALKTQNDDQQKQIDGLKLGMKMQEADCDRRLSELEAKHKQIEATVEQVKNGKH